MITGSVNLEEAVKAINNAQSKRKYISKTQLNKEKIEEIMCDGRDWCLKGELPCPSAVNRLINNGPVLAVCGCRVYFREKLS